MVVASPIVSADEEWIDLSSDSSLDVWAGAEDGWAKKGWIVAREASLDSENSAALVAKPGDGVLISTLQGDAPFRNLASRRQFADVEVHVEFLLPKRGNAGVKLQGLYEIQMADSHGKEKPAADDCGGVYPRAELFPRYRILDEGYPPRVNAARPAGEWQTLDIVFQAPRFDASGKKTENARFVKVTLNGEVIHEDVELKWPTGHAWRTKKEVAEGPLFLQGDHGPVAYRNVKVRPIP